MNSSQGNPPATALVFGNSDVHPRVGDRLDVFLATVLQRSRNHAQTLLKRGLVHVKPASARAEPSYRLRLGDTVTVHPMPPSAPVAGSPAAEAIPLDIIYEDEALLALNKQAGLVVHPAAGHPTGTLVNALVHHLDRRLARRGGNDRSGIVHRLDKDTSGIILIAKTDEAHEHLSRAFARRDVRKTYRALCRGVFRRASGECRSPIGRHPIDRKKMAVMKNPTKGRSAWTDYRVLGQGRHGAEVECLLHTGRTHQIRVHLAHLGHPIWGDLVYGRQHVLPDGTEAPRQMLHAARIEISHPLTGVPLCLEAPLPADYKECRERLVLTDGSNASP
ncbi:MAG: RluA family pseudouridine synthase [Methylacidiphilales bacterium]|nr:RluA family pseudouridine synthase [Candidatus Methylacidiphilales bacterium]